MREVKRLLKTGRCLWDCKVAAFETASGSLLSPCGPTWVSPDDLRLIQWMTGAWHTGPFLSPSGAQYQAQADGSLPLPQAKSSNVVARITLGLNPPLHYRFAHQATSKLCLPPKEVFSN